MFTITSIFDIFSVVSFILSSWLAIHKLFVVGKPKIKFDVKFATLHNVEDQTKYLIFNMVNTGSGDIHLTNCGFCTPTKEKQRVVVLPGGYRTIPMGERFPYSLKERKRFEVLYPIETIKKIDADGKINHFYVNDETGREWKYKIGNFRNKVLENNRNSI